MFLCVVSMSSPVSVTKQEVIDAVYQQTGRKVADTDLEVPEIKTLGTFECSVKLVRMLLSGWLGSNSYAQWWSAAGSCVNQPGSQYGLVPANGLAVHNSMGQLVCIM
jgi:hypothetical protein